MTEQEILSNLCCYDDRNPDMVDGDLPQDERPQRKPICHCDNCFYGRTRMAEYILELQTNLTVTQEHLKAVESRAVILEARCARYELTTKT